MILAADPRVPRRDALLRPETMAGVLSQRLHAGVPVDACSRMYVTVSYTHLTLPTN